jgi:predicted 3-demethylubiquinone-9 3-methyltransferase (glyoxalase superfamily)
MQKITPFLCFDNNAEEAVNFYISIFKNSKIGQVRRYGEAGPGPKGSVMTATFQIEGQEFMALNGGPGSSFHRQFRSSSIAKHRKKWTSCGKTCLRAEKPCTAAG